MILRRRIQLLFCTFLIFHAFVNGQHSSPWPDIDERENAIESTDVYTSVENSFSSVADHFQEVVDISTTESGISTEKVTEAYCEDELRSVDNLTVSNKSDSSITVRWTYEISTDCISNFLVNYSDGNENKSELIDSTVFEYVMSNLKSCTTYEISVIAVGINDSFSPAQIVTETTDVSQISDVNNLTVEGIENSLNVNWDPPNDVSCLKHYLVSAKTEDNATVTPANVSSQNTSYTFHDLSPCTVYIVEVTPVGIDNEVGIVASASGTTQFSLPGAISDLTLEEITGSSAYLTWSAPTVNPTCVSSYNIEACNGSDCTTYNSTNVFYNATNLKPCLNYRFTVGAVGKAGSAETLSIFNETSYVAPGEVDSFTARPDEFSMIIHWKPPLIGATCTRNYRFTLWESGYTATTSNMNYKFENLTACKNYTVQIIPVSVTNGDGPLHITSAIILPSVDDPPVRIGEYSETKNTIPVGWRIERNMNECPLKTLLTSCYATSTDGHGFELLNGTAEYDLSNSPSTNNTEIKIEVKNLSPFTNYNCYGYLINSAGKSDGSLITAKTWEDVPSAPVLTASQLRNVTFLFGWTEPTYLAGNLTEHEIRFSWLPKFSMPNSCNYTKLSGGIPSIAGALREYFVSNATPYSKYIARIRAKTNAGWGDYSDAITFDTEAGVPGVVRDIRYSTPPNANNANLLDTFLSWGLPCFSNGIIELFNIGVHGTRDGFDDHRFSRVCNATEYSIANHLFKINLEELKAEYNYTYRISAKVMGVPEYGMSSSINEIYPAGIPPMPDETYMDSITIKPLQAMRSSSTATVLLPLFGNKNGEIRYYAVMIAQMGQSIHTSNRFDIRNGSWPSVISWQEAIAHDPIVTYQATLPKWNPKTTGQIEKYNHTLAVRFVLGGDDTCSESLTPRSYCNGPLKPDTVYQIRMRAFTYGGYIDSKAIIAKTKAEFNVGLVIGVVFGILFLGIITTMMLLVRKGDFRAIIKNPRAQTSPVPDPLTRKKFEIHCQDLIENPGKLSNEFQLLHTLSVDLQMSTNDAMLQANKKKNRYLDILPYDISRVKLDLVDNDPNTDYINASFIHGYTGVVEYIACQGPKEETTYDFWRMIFQYNVKIIVMVTQLIEKDKEKCYQYYPNMRENFEYEDITIRCSTQLDFVFYTQRTIILQMNDVKRTVTHLHFKEWSDHGVPDDFHSMIHFCQTVRKQMNDNKGLAVIHCSAGVGRTGTLITVDILLQHIRDNRRLDVFGTVFNLRKDRINMVQTESQYAYIYNCTRQALNNPYSLKHSKPPSVDPLYENLALKRNEITDLNTNLVNSAESLKKLSPSSSIDSMEPIYEVVRQRPSYATQLSTLSNGLRYTKSTGAIDHLVSPGVEIVRYGSHEYPIFEPAPDTLSNRGSIDRNALLRSARPSRARQG